MLPVIRKPSSVVQYDHVYSDDPAIDTESEALDHEKWKESGDPQFLPFKPDQKPTVFRMRHLTARQHAHLMNVAEDSGMAVATFEAFRYCVLKVSGIEFELAQEDGHEVVPDSVVDSIYDCPDFRRGAIVREVGVRAITEAMPKK